MRIVEVTGGLGHRQGGTGAPPSRGQAGSVILGPESEAAHHGLVASLHDSLAARRAGHLVHVQDERAGAPPGVHSIKSFRKAGSKHAVLDLQTRLGDNWVLLRGYQNSCGPIGQLLIGPAGVIAMTSLHLEAAVRCHGNKWHAEWLAASTQQHGELHLDDLDGRSPSVQLNQSADELESLLRAAGTPVSIERVVLFSHPRTRVENCLRPAVRIFASAGDLVFWLHELPKTLDRGVKRQLEDLITGKPGQADDQRAPAPAPD